MRDEIQLIHDRDTRMIKDLALFSCAIALILGLAKVMGVLG